MKTAYVFYHDPCSDGFTAAWIARRALLQTMDEVVMCPVNYGRIGSDVAMALSHAVIHPEDVEVYVLDFSFSREITEQFIATGCEFVCLDHHKTAAGTLEGLEGCYFDMKRSGAMMAWDYFNACGDAPNLVEYVQDRDLWKHDLDDTHEVNAYIRAQEMTWDSWDALADDLGDCDGYSKAVTVGGYLLAQEARQIEKIMKEAIYSILPGGYRVWEVNSPIHQSKVGNLLAARPDTDYANVWYVAAVPGSSLDAFNQGEFVTRNSLRSVGDFDVSEVAARRGGGGHKNAAGYQS